MKCLIGNVELKNQVVLAPMAGVSNPTYIKICEDFGVGYAVTELISAEAIVRGNKKTFKMLDGIENINIPVGIQLFGANPQTMALAAQKLVNDYHAKIIDINMGCPVVKVAIKNEAGSALMKNPKLVYDIVSEVVNAVDVPVTVKMRSGWDTNSINAVEIAKVVEKAGAKAVTIHARTRSQFYAGEADWNIIKQVVENVSIPVIGNGDIRTCYDAARMLEETGCSMVMIGRALMGNPWLIRECIDYIDKGLIPKKVSIDERINMMELHLKKLVNANGEKGAVLEMRGHLLNYLQGLPNNKEIKNRVCQAKKKNEIIDILEEYRKVLKECQS